MSSVASAATRHSALNRGIMLDWLKVCIDEERPLPSDEQIADRFRFETVEQARTLLADLADRGEIRITHGMEGREITLGGGRVLHRCERAMPSVPVRKPSAIPPTVDEAVERIRSIVNRRPKPGPKIVQAPKPAAAPEAPAGQAPALGSEVSHSPPTDRPYRQRPQTNMRLSTAAQDALERRRLPGETAAAAAKRLIEKLLLEPASTSDPAVAMTGKPLVRAAVLREANRAGLDLHIFVSQLIDIGFDAYMEAGE